MLHRLFFLLNLLHICFGDSITIYEYTDYEGDYEKMLMNSDECRNLPEFWIERTSSARVNADCIALFDSEDCTGESLKLGRTSANSNNFRKLNFLYKLTSVQRCRGVKETVSPRSRTRYKPVPGLCLEEHNDYRAMYGLPALESNFFLERASQRHIEKVARHRCHEIGSPHQCPGEKKLSERFEDAGYVDFKAGAENIGIGYGDCKSAVDGWMTSPDHKKIILKNFRHIGCGKKLDMWACGFASPFAGALVDSHSDSGGWSASNEH